MCYIKKLKSLVLLLCLPFGLIAQEKKDFSFEYGLSVSNYDMKLPKQYIAEDSTYSYFDKVTAKNNSLNSLDIGLSHNFSVHYQPISFLDFGIISSFQYAKYTRTFEFQDYLNPDESGNYPIVQGGIVNKTQSFAVGISTNVYINKLSHFETKTYPILNKLVVAIGLSGLYGRNEFIEVSGNEKFNYDIKNLRFGDDNFQFRAALKVGYRIFRESYFSVIGLKFGYQYLQTSQVKSYGGLVLSTPDSPAAAVKLNFSGLYYGLYLQMGK